MRSHKLGDLVFRADGKAPTKRRASVKLVYKVDDGEVEDLEVKRGGAVRALLLLTASSERSSHTTELGLPSYLYQEGEELHFMRTIAASGVGSYRINDVEVTWEAYDKRLHQIGVLTKARNFLVFQV